MRENRTSGFLEGRALKGVRLLDLLIRDIAAYVTEYGLSHLCTKKRELELLWNQPTLGRNVFDEMIDAGASKVENEIKNHKTISPEKKALADWYAKLLVNNYLVTVRWWFSHSDTVSASQITEMMERHMISGTISTLLS